MTALLLTSTPGGAGLDQLSALAPALLQIVIGLIVVVGVILAAITLLVVLGERGKFQ